MPNKLLRSAPLALCLSVAPLAAAMAGSDVSIVTNDSYNTTREMVASQTLSSTVGNNTQATGGGSASTVIIGDAVASIGNGTTGVALSAATNGVGSNVVQDVNLVIDFLKL